MTGIMQMDSFKPENDASDGQDITFSYVLSVRAERAHP